MLEDLITEDIASVDDITVGTWILHNIHSIHSIQRVLVFALVQQIIGYVKGPFAFIFIKLCIQNLDRHVACMDEIRNEYKCLLENIEERGHLAALGTDGRIILKRMFDKYSVKDLYRQVQYRSKSGAIMKARILYPCFQYSHIS
jgi:hypothetical protein